MIEAAPLPRAPVAVGRSVGRCVGWQVHQLEDEAWSTGLRRRHNRGSSDPLPESYRFRGLRELLGLGLRIHFVHRIAD